MTRPDLQAVWFARGGYGTARLLQDLPWSELRSRPVVGFSDATALFCGMRRAAVAGALHGPVLQSLADLADEDSRQVLRALLMRGEAWDCPVRSLLPGTARAPLAGGNLCTLASMAGTPHALQARGCVLVLEDVGERPYRLHRLLSQLLASGGLDGVLGVALGSFEGCFEPGEPDWRPESILAELLEPLGVPVVAGLPVGHGPRNFGYPWGASAWIQEGRFGFDASRSV